MLKDTCLLSVGDRRVAASRHVAVEGHLQSVAVGRIVKETTKETSTGTGLHHISVEGRVGLRGHSRKTTSMWRSRKITSMWSSRKITLQSEDLGLSLCVCKISIYWHASMLGEWTSLSWSTRKMAAHVSRTFWLHLMGKKEMTVLFMWSK